MKNATSSLERGKKDAERFIAEERIEYEPFVAMSDLHMVRKTFALTYETFRDTVKKLDADLWALIDDSAAEVKKEQGKDFNPDQYAEGFTEGVAAVWEKIRDKVL